MVAQHERVRISKTESIDPVVAVCGAGKLTCIVPLAKNGSSDANGI